MRRLLEWLLCAPSVGFRVKILEEATKDTIKSFVFLMNKEGISPREYVEGRESGIEEKNKFMTEVSKAYLMKSMQDTQDPKRQASIMRTINKINEGEIQIDLSRDE